MICTTKAYQGVYYEGTGVKIVRVICVAESFRARSGDSYVLGDSSSVTWGKNGSLNDKLAYEILKDAFSVSFAQNNWIDFQDNVIDKLTPKAGWIILKEELMQRYDAEVTLMALGSIGEKKS